MDNVIQANLLAARPSGPSGLTCNIASGTRSSLLELLESINEAVGDIPHSYADISVARQALGYSVCVPFREAIRRTLASYRDPRSKPTAMGDGASASGA